MRPGHCSSCDGHPPDEPWMPALAARSEEDEPSDGTIARYVAAHPRAARSEPGADGLRWLDGPFLARVWAMSGRHDPLSEPAAWDGFALTLRSLAEVEGSAATPAADSRGLPPYVGVERVMVVLRPWLGIHDDVELERACRRILSALTDPEPASDLTMRKYADKPEAERKALWEAANAEEPS